MFPGTCTYNGQLRWPLQAAVNTPFNLGSKPKVHMPVPDDIPHPSNSDDSHRIRSHFHLMMRISRPSTHRGNRERNEAPHDARSIPGIFYYPLGFVRFYANPAGAWFGDRLNLCVGDNCVQWPVPGLEHREYSCA